MTHRVVAGRRNTTRHGHKVHRTSPLPSFTPPRTALSTRISWSPFRRWQKYQERQHKQWKQDHLPGRENVKSFRHCPHQQESFLCHSTPSRRGHHHKSDAVGLHIGRLNLSYYCQDTCHGKMGGGILVALPTSNTPSRDCYLAAQLCCPTFYNKP